MEEPGYLNGGAPDATACSQDEHVFTRPDAASLDKHVPGGQKNQGNGRGVVESQPFGVGEGIYRGYLYKLGITPVREVPQNRIAPAEAVLALKAKCALHAGKSRTDQGLVSRLAMGDARSDAFHNSGHVGAGDVGQGELDSRQAPALPDVQVIQRTGLDSDDHFPRAGMGVRGVFVTKFLDSAVLVKSYRLHGKLAERPKW